MILQALNNYYLRRQRSADPQNRLPAFGLEEKEIPFVIEIDGEGRLIQLADTRTTEGKKRIGQRFLVPQGAKKTSGVAANLLWDTAEYVLGIDTKGKPKRVIEQHKAYRARVEGLPEPVLNDAGIRAVLAFLNDVPLAQLQLLPGWDEVIATNPVVSFRLHGELELVCQRPAIVAASGTMSEVADGICLIDGNEAPIERLHSSIKNVWGAQTSGANIVSFNLDAFNSYGKAQGANAPVGKAAAFAYTTALNHLLASGSRQRMQVGDASTVFWAEEAHDLESMVPDLFGEPPKDEPDRGTAALRALYQAAHSGQFACGTGATRFHVLGLAPNAARIAIRFWETAPAQEIARRIALHFDDIRVIRAPHDPEHLSLFRLLTAVAALGDAKRIPPRLGGDIVRSIVEGLPYPSTLLTLAVQRIRAEQHPSRARAAIIKAVLNRQIRRANATALYPDKEFHPMLDTSNNNKAYRLGRLFATLEKIQEEASPGLNSTIRDRYYNAASSMPVAVFSTLLRLKNHHLRKLPKGRAVQMEKLTGEILSELNDFPRNLPLPDQGRFALGYYHQRQAFFTKSEPTRQQEELQ
jgi:CRISPR-associated protein Csd1